MCMKKVINLYKLSPHTVLTSTFNFASIICYCCWCCYWHHLVLWFCLLNLFIFHRAARNLLEDFVGIYLDGNSSFLQETVDKKCLQFEVNISFMLSICKHEICTFIMWKAICVGFIYIYKLYIYIYNFIFLFIYLFSVHITMGTNSTCITANSHLMLCKTGGWLALHHSIAVLCDANFNSVLYVIWDYSYYYLLSIIHPILLANTVHNDNSSITEVFSLS